MKLLSWRDARYRFALLSLLIVVSLQLFPLMSNAQNLGQTASRRARPCRDKPLPSRKEPCSIW